MLGFLLISFELWLLLIVALIFQYYSPRIGLAPLLFYIAGLVVLLNIEFFFEVLVYPIPEIRMSIATNVIVPILLSMILLVYIVNGTNAAQVVFYNIAGLHLFVLFTLGFPTLVLNAGLDNVVPDGVLAVSGAVTPLYLQRRLASMVAMVINGYLITVSYQFFRNRFPKAPRWLLVTITIVVALLANSLIFTMISRWGVTADIMPILARDMMTKLLAAMSVLPVILFYIQYLVPHLPEPIDENRPTLDSVFGTFERLTGSLRQMQRQLDSNNQIYEQLTAHIDAVFWLADAKTNRFIYFSPAFQRITGYDPELFLADSMKILEIVHPNDRNLGHFKNNFELMSHRPVREFRIVKPDGEIRWVRDNGFPINDANGETYRFAGLLEDISDQRNIQKQKFELAVANERMRLLHEFVRDASHDLKTPLASIMIKADLLTRVDGEKRDRIALEMRNSAAYLSELIDDLFMLSHIESAETITMVAIDLNHIILKVIANTQSITDEKGLYLKAESKPIPKIVGNPDQMARLFTNLISNAIRYTQKGGIIVRTWDDSEFVYVSITDTGVGINQDDLERIFERFFRAKTGRSEKGTGLGLAIAKAIIDRHSGQILVDSAVDQGTIFTVRLPVRQTINLPPTRDDLKSQTSISLSSIEK